MSLAVSDEEVQAWRQKFAGKEGLNVGYSVAANVCAVGKLLRSGRLGADAVVATILCDTGLKY